MKRGKACALNTALSYVETEWFGVIDSDCELRDACSLKRLCDSVTDKTIAVGERLFIRRKLNPITWIQDMEYKRTFLHKRQVSRDVGNVTLISGVFGIFKKDIVINAGVYCEEFVGEDMDIVLRIQRYCRTKHRKYHIAYESRAVCLTNVPSSMHRLFRQRDIWQRGLIGSFLRNTTFRPDKGILMRWIALPYMLRELMDFAT